MSDSRLTCAVRCRECILLLFSSLKNSINISNNKVYDHINQTTMKKIFALMLNFTVVATLSAQIGINTQTPDASAALDVVSTDKGMLIPRMTTAQKTAISTPAEGLIVYDTTLKCISQNAGTTTSPAWVCLSSVDAQNISFYMPSIAIDASSVASGQTLDLYEEYKKQFSGATPSQFAKSTGAPSTIPYYPTADSLYYYITYYDNNILNINSIDANGKVLYDVLAEAEYSSFITVVFVIK